MLTTVFLNWIHVGQFWECTVSQRGWRVKEHMDESQQAKQDRHSSCLCSFYIINCPQTDCNLLKMNWLPEMAC